MATVVMVIIGVVTFLNAMTVVMVIIGVVTLLNAMVDVLATEVHACLTGRSEWKR